MRWPLRRELVQQLVVAALRDAECLPGPDRTICGLAVVEDGDRSLAVHIPARRLGAHGRVEARLQEPFEQQRRCRPRVRRPGSARDPLDSLWVGGRDDVGYLGFAGAYVLVPVG